MKSFSFLCLLLFSNGLLAEISDNPVNFSDVLNLEVPAPDAVIRYGESELQFGELWLPKQPSQGLVVFVHGGCWLNQFDVGHSRPLAHALSKNGFAVWSLEYRRLGDPGGGFPGTFDDLDLATSHLGKLSAHGINTDKTVVAGHSAGGHLALWIAAKFPERFTGVIGLAAITDLLDYAAGESACNKAAATLMDGAPSEQFNRYQAHSPSHMTIHTNTQLIQGAQDTIVPINQARTLGLDTENIKLTQGGHFDVIHPDTPDFGVVIQSIRDSLK